MNLLDGKKVSEELNAALKKEITHLKSNGIYPSLHAILVGDDAASKVYVNIKKKTCEQLGINSEIHLMPRDTSKRDLELLIKELNARKDVNGILVQLPLPERINKYSVIDLIDPRKDVDGLTQTNIARLMRGYDCLKPCTPEGIIQLLTYYKISIEGKNVAVIGQGDIAGKPLSLMLSEKGATVTMCHIKTNNVKYYTSNADITVIAIGSPRYLTAEMIKEGSIVIDIGINKIDGKLVGDADFDSISRKASYATPVPGGVGPMTVAYLMKNTVKATMRLYCWS